MKAEMSKQGSRVVRLSGWLSLVLSLGLMSLLSGCSKDFFSAITNPPGGSGSSTYVFVTNVNSTGSGGTLSAYSLTGGVLAELSGSPYTLGATPTSLAVSPKNTSLYVGTSLGIFVYTIGSGGALTEANSSTIIYQGPSQPQSIVVDETSSWLLVANQNSNELDVVAVDPTSGLPTNQSPVTQAVTLDVATPQQLILSPANNNVFVAVGTNGVRALSFTPTASSPVGTKLVTIQPHFSGGADNYVAVDPTSAYLYATEALTTSSGSSASNILRTFSIANSTISNEVTYPTGRTPTAVLADTSGDYVYVSNQSDNTISGFSASAGVLTAMANSPFATAKTPVGLVEDSSKTYIFSIGFGSNPNLWLYNFDTSSLGTLDVKTTTSTTTTSPSNSNAIAVTH